MSARWQSLRQQSWRPRTWLPRLESWEPRSWRPWLAVGLVAPAMALFLGDRAGAEIAGANIRDRVESELAAYEVEHGSVTVDVAGTPFLTQAVTRTLDEITISITDLRASPDAEETATPITVASVDVVATAVRFNLGDFLRGEPTATAQQVVGTAFITYAALDGLVDLSGLSLADVHFSEFEGGIRFAALGPLAPVQAVADVTVEDGRLRVKLRDAQFVSLALPAAGRDLLDQILALTIDVLMPTLPLGLTLQSVTAEPNGLSISVVGHDVPLTVQS